MPDIRMLLPIFFPVYFRLMPYMKPVISATTLSPNRTKMTSMILLMSFAFFVKTFTST